MILIRDYCRPILAIIAQYELTYRPMRVADIQAFLLSNRGQK